MAAQWFPNLEAPMELKEHQRQGDYADRCREQQTGVIPSSQKAQNQSDNQLFQYSINSGANTNTGVLNNQVPIISKKSITSVQTTYQGSHIAEQISSSSTILSFGAQDVKTMEQAMFYGCVQPRKEAAISLPTIIVGKVGGNNKSYDAVVTGDIMRKASGNDIMRIYSQSQREREEHILAERKRREILSQRFIALSKIVPGLKKMDKASVLEDATKYLTQLQHRVQDLEAQATKQTVESAAIVKKFDVPSDGCNDAGNDSPCNENLLTAKTVLKHLPEIEAKMSEQTIIFKIYCKNQKGALVKVLAEIEALGLSITSTSMMQFAGSSLNITAVAQVEVDSLSVNDVVKKLNQAIRVILVGNSFV